MTELSETQRQEFLRLFTEHEPALRSFVGSLALPAADASDVLQQVSVVLWRKFGEFDPARDFRKWAFGVARYETLTFRRDRARDRHVFDPELVDRLADEAAAAAPRHDAQREALETCLQKLPEAQRALVLASYAPGVRIDELAARRGQTPMSLYKQLQRLRQTLLECMQQHAAHP